MKKIGLVLVVAALGVAGYVLVNKHYAMSESGNVVVQTKNPFSKKNMEKANFTNSCGESKNCKPDEWCDASQCKKRKNTCDECFFDTECKSGICKGDGQAICWETQDYQGKC